MATMRPAVRLKEVTLIAGNTSGTVIGEIVDLEEVLGLSVYCKITDISPAVGSAGTFSLEISLNGVDWIILPDSDINLIAPDDCIIEYKEPYFRYLRPKLTMSSGNVSVTCSFYAKVV